MFEGDVVDIAILVLACGVLVVVVLFLRARRRGPEATEVEIPPMPAVPTFEEPPDYEPAESIAEPDPFSAPPKVDPPPATAQVSPPQVPLAPTPPVEARVPPPAPAAPAHVPPPQVPLAPTPPVEARVPPPAAAAPAHVPPPQVPLAPPHAPPPVQARPPVQPQVPPPARVATNGSVGGRAPLLAPVEAPIPESDEILTAQSGELMAVSSRWGAGRGISTSGSEAETPIPESDEILTAQSGELMAVTELPEVLPPIPKPIHPPQTRAEEPRQVRAISERPTNPVRGEGAPKPDVAVPKPPGMPRPIPPSSRDESPKQVAAGGRGPGAPKPKMDAPKPRSPGAYKVVKPETPRGAPLGPPAGAGEGDKEKTGLAKPKSPPAGVATNRPPLAPALPAPATDRQHSDPSHKKARQLARLFVSEIVLYNPDEVKAGRQKGDLYKRLKRDIDQCRVVMKQRVPAEVLTEFDYLYDEMLKQLAEGDASKFGPGMFAPDPPR